MAVVHNMEMTVSFDAGESNLCQTYLSWSIFEQMGQRACEKELMWVPVKFGQWIEHESSLSIIGSSNYLRSNCIVHLLIRKARVHSSTE